MNTPDVFKRIFFTQAPVIGFVVDAATFQFIDANQTALAEYGYTWDEMMKLRIVDLLPRSESLSPIFVERLNALADNEHVLIQTRHEAKDGKELYLIFHATAVHDSGKRRYMCMGQNITSQKELEQELHGIRQAGSHAVSDVAGRVQRAYHDMRAPLTSVRGLLNVVRAKSNDAALTTYFDLMNESLIQMDERIGLLLEKDHPKTALENVERIDLKTIVDDILKQISFIKGFERIRITTKVLNQTPFVSQPKLLRLVLENLITNAVNHHDTKQPDPTVDVTFMTMQRECAIEISDNGVGMEPHQVDKIFSRYYRVDESSKVGTGVGLHLVKESLDRLGGKITVMSRKGIGSNFLVRIPNLYDAAKHKTSSRTSNENVLLEKE
jgi:PAS domain S-box-containing protein